MSGMTTTFVVLAGLLAVGGLVLRHQLRIAPLIEEPEPNHTRRTPGPATAYRQCRQVRPTRPQRTNPANKRRWLRRLRVEERRQRPQEGRN
ncbi:MAG: hypothetical protein RL091_264 [Verrucomicrobiota bacterium]